MTDVLIKRELLERLTAYMRQRVCPAPSGKVATELHADLTAALAAPRQPEGDAISHERVQSEADAFFDWPTADKSSVTTTSCLIFARCIAGMVSAERDATIAELREECEHLKACQENAMLHMTGLVAERDTLRQQLAELHDLHAESMLDIHELKEQRDKLAGLLQKARWYVASARYSDNDEGDFAARRRDVMLTDINAALAEVDK